MSVNGTSIENNDEDNDLLISVLHERDQLFNSSAIRFGCFRNILLSHFDDYLIKRARANKRGLTKVIIGLRAADKVIIYSRSTPVDIKENVRAEIELFMTHMTNTILKMNESSDEPETLLTCEHALVNLVNKFVYHESVRGEILKKAKEINDFYKKLCLSISVYIYKKTGRKIPDVGKMLFSFDERFIEVVTGVNAVSLKCEIVSVKQRELETLCDLLELNSVEELLSQWKRVQGMMDSYSVYIKSRNKFVTTVTPLVTQLCNRDLNKHQYSHNRKGFCEVLVQSCISKLLSNILMYVPNNSYTTFAFPHIKQEIQIELAQVGLISLPATYKKLQKNVIEAGKEVGKEWCPMRAMVKLKESHPAVPWTVDLITHCRFGNVLSESIHSDDDDESSFEHPIISTNNPEKELRNTQLIEKVMKRLNTEAPDFKKGLLEYLSDNSDSFSISKSSLVNPDKFSDASNYRIKKFILDLREEFKDQENEHK